MQSLVIGGDPRCEVNGSSILVKNLLRHVPAQLFLVSKSRPLAGAITITPQADRTKLTIALEPGIALEGRIKDESGVPIKDASVMLCAGEVAGGHVPYLPGGIATTTTDAQGRYKFGLVVPGVTYCVQMYHRSYARAQATVTVDSTARTAKVDDIVALKRVPIGGRVTDKTTGQPIEGVTVHFGVDWEASYAKSGAWNGGPAYQWDVVTDNGGRWSFEANPNLVDYAYVDDLRYHMMSYDKIEAGAVKC